MNRPNKRRHERIPSSEPVALRWREDSGKAHFEPGTVIDYSESGLRIELMEPIRLLSYVIVGPQGQNKEACAGKVRYCLPKQTKYIVGLDLATPSRQESNETQLDVAEVLQTPEFSLLMFRP